MKFSLLFLCFSLVLHNAYCALTEKQLNATKKLVRNTCQNKAKATSEQIDAMQHGDFGGDKNFQLSKESVFDWEGGIKALAANAPPNIADAGSISVKNCKDAVKTPEDRCVAAMEITKCIYDDNPSNYFLP